MDFTYPRSDISQKLEDMHQIWTLHILEVIFHTNLEDLRQIWTLSRKGPDIVRSLSAGQQGHKLSSPKSMIWFSIK